MENNSNTFSLEFRNIINYLLSKKKLLFFINIAAIVLFLIVSYIIPHKYTSTSTLLPSEEVGGSSLATFLQSFSNLELLGGKQSSKVQIYFEILRSNEIIWNTVHRGSIKDLEPLRGLDTLQLARLIDKGLKVSLRQTGLIEVSFSYSTPFFPGRKSKEAAAYTSAVMLKEILSALDSLARSRISTRSKRKRILIESLLAQKKIELDSIEQVLEDFRKKHKILALDEQSQAMLRTAIEIGSELARAEIELQLANAEFESNAPIIHTLKEKVQQLRSQYERVQSGGLTGTETFTIPLPQLPSLIREYTNLVRRQKILEQVNIFLETQMYQAAIQEQTEIPSVDVLDLPRVPLKQSSPSRPLFLLIGFLISLTFSVVYFIYDGYKKGKIKTQTERN